MVYWLHPCGDIALAMPLPSAPARIFWYSGASAPANQSAHLLSSRFLLYTIAAYNQIHCYVEDQFEVSWYTTQSSICNGSGSSSPGSPVGVENGNNAVRYAAGHIAGIVLWFWIPHSIGCAFRNSQCFRKRPIVAYLFLKNSTGYFHRRAAVF